MSLSPDEAAVTIVASSVVMWDPEAPCGDPLEECEWFSCSEGREFTYGESKSSEPISY